MIAIKTFLARLRIFDCMGMRYQPNPLEQAILEFHNVGVRQRLRFRKIRSRYAGRRKIRAGQLSKLEALSGGGIEQLAALDTRVDRDQGSFRKRFNEDQNGRIPLDVDQHHGSFHA